MYTVYVYVYCGRLCILWTFVYTVDVFVYCGLQEVHLCMFTVPNSEAEILNILKLP